MAQKSKTPTAEQRKLVKSMAAAGIQSEAICLVIGVSGKTLRKHYRTELDTAAIRANAMVAGSLYMKAIKGNVTAQIFWLKTRAGWREVARFEHSGNVGTYDLTKISDADLSKLESILGTLADNRPDPVGAGTPAFVPGIKSDPAT